MRAARSLIALLSPGFGFHLSPLAPYGSLRLCCCCLETETEAQVVVPGVRRAPEPDADRKLQPRLRPAAATVDPPRAIRLTYRITC